MTITYSCGTKQSYVNGALGLAQRQKGNLIGAEIERVLREWFGDVALPSAADETKTMEIITQVPKPEFEIPTVNEALYNQTREALAKKGYTFVVAIKPESIGQLLVDAATSRRFGYVNNSDKMRAIVPQQMEIAINPNKLRIKKSNNKSTGDQIRMLEEEAAALKAKLPSEAGNIIDMRMPHASTLVQLDDQYKKATGEPLFTNWFGRTNDQTVPGDVALVGRFAPSSELNVVDWDRDLGSVGVFAVPVVVLPRKLAA